MIASMTPETMPRHYIEHQPEGAGTSSTPAQSGRNQMGDSDRPVLPRSKPAKPVPLSPTGSLVVLRSCPHGPAGIVQGMRRGPNLRALGRSVLLGQRQGVSAHAGGSRNVKA